MSDITSGYNIAEDISLEPAFYDLCGFWESEIEEILVQLVESCSWKASKVAEALEMIKLFYNGYCFKIARTKSDLLYNPTLSLYFLKHYQRHCRPPRKMLDGNFAMDRAKMAYVASLREGEQLVTAALAEKEPVAIYELEDRFGVADLLSTDQDRQFFASLLYYLGVLTLGQIDEKGKLILKIPNLVVRKLYVEHLQKKLLPNSERTEAKRVAETLCSTGDIEPLCDFIEQRYYPIFDNRDYKSANELTLKTIFLTLLFNDTVYIMDSEMALERTYSDLTMIVRPEMRQYQQLDLLLEFKFVKLNKVELSGQEVKQKSREELLAIEKVKDKLKEASTQVKGYRKRLLDKYGSTLNLRTFAVIGLGFEKVVWEEVP